MDSSAVVGSCVPGTNSTRFKEAVLRRINWFRAMAGVPAAVAFDPTFSAKSQKAALMMSVNDSLSHYPPSSWTCYTADGYEAAHNSNLGLGTAGPDVITGYIGDAGLNNAAVGHRRWLLYPQTQLMGTGDVPAQGGHYEANSTWVFDGNFGGPRPAVRDGFVSWPPPGFTPYQAVFGRWSFSYPDADFQSARVFMRSNGVPIPVALETVALGRGENTLVWIPAGLPSDGSTEWPRPATNAVYSITISNVVGASASVYNYTVTVFDPAVAGPDHRPPTVSGTNQPAIGQSNLYSFSAVSNASAYQWRQAARRAASFFDGAENPLTNFVVAADTNLYAVRVPSPVASGTRAFHLAHCARAPQILTLARTFYARTNSALTFRSRLGIATDQEYARVQLSTDDGVRWSEIYFQAGDNLDEGSFTLRTVSLAGQAGKILRLRFNFDVANSWYPTADNYYGWYFDNITVTNVDEILSQTTAATKGTNFHFIPGAAGGYNLDVRALLYGEFPLDWGPVKEVTAVTAAAPVSVSQRILPLSGNQVRIDFTLQSGTPPLFRLLRSDSVTGPWVNDSNAVLTTNTPGASWRFTATPGGAVRRFYRVSTNP